MTIAFMKNFITILLIGAALAENATEVSLGRVVNGVNAKPGQYPYMISLHLKPQCKFFCGGSILSPFWVLTAGHCVSKIKADEIEIHFGATELNVESHGITNVEKAIIHHNFTSNFGVTNDIALLKLVNRLWFVPGIVEAVKLPPSKYELLPGVNATIIGWGLNATGGSVQNHLKQADLIVLSDTDCIDRTMGAATKQQICCTTPKGSFKQCNGDSGGPLMSKNGFQIGIVSWSVKPCGVIPLPGVYTKVSHFIDWITECLNSSG